MKAPQWSSEAEMLAAFIADAKAAGWRVYPEQCEFDVVLVAGPQRHRDGPREGDIVAVEGKLRANLKVLAQVMPPWRSAWERRHGGGKFRRPVADWYCVVVGTAPREFRDIAAALGVAVHCPVHPSQRSRYRGEGYHWEPAWPEWMRSPPEAPRIQPLLEVDIPAGVPAPQSVTPWKVAAVRFCLRGGQFTSAECPVDVRRFLDRGWARRIGSRGRRALYELVEPAPADRPDLAYPSLADALRAEGCARPPELP